MATPFSYHDQVRAGNMFIAFTATAAAIPKYDATTLKFVLWNKAGSNVNAVLVRYMAGWAATTENPGNIQLMQINPAGSALGTNEPFSAYTQGGTITNALIGGGRANKCVLGTTVTATAAGTQMLTFGMNHLTTTGTATFGSFTYVYDFWETVIVPPNTAVYTVQTGTAASTYNESLIWYEEPALG